jgi:N-acetylmuramoyl-L-alanine amidase
MGGWLPVSRLAGAIIAPVFLSIGSFLCIGTAAAEPDPTTPFLTEEAPLRPLAGSFGFRTSGSVRTGRVRIFSDCPTGGHEIVISPGIPRALIDGRGVPLLTAPRFVGGELVVPAELADIIRRMGDGGASAETPSGDRPAPRRRTEKAAFLPAPTDHTTLLLAGGASGSKAEKKGKPAKTAKTPAADLPAGKRPAPVEAKGLVLIDPGHGGKDEGARGPKGTKEKDVVLAVAKLLAEELRSRGVRVELTRTDDAFLSLATRAAAVNRLKPDLLVSLHVNSYPKGSVAGVETWVSRARPARSKKAMKESCALAKKSGEFAKTVQAALVKATADRDRGVRQGYFRVLRKSSVPAVLVEMGFVSNPATEKKLLDDGHREKIAKALAGAIADSGLLKRRGTK